MAWIDDRIWCHTKFTDLSDRAAWTWVKGVAYSSGMSTAGALTPGQQKMIGADKRVRRELVAAGLWDEATDGSEAVTIHGWEEHNSKRDARREADRERKRRARGGGTSAGTSAGQSAGHSAGHSAGTSNGGSAGPAHVEGSEGSEGPPSEIQTISEGGAEPNAQSLTGEFVDACRDADIEAPRRVVGQIAQATRRLLDEGIGGDAIRAGYRRMVQRGLVQPALLPNFVAEASIPSGLRPPANGSMTADQIREYGRRLDAR